VKISLFISKFTVNPRGYIEPNVRNTTYIILRHVTWQRRHYATSYCLATPPLIVCFFAWVHRDRKRVRRRV